MASALITKGLSTPGSIPEYLLRGFSPSSIASMTASIISGTGSVGQLSGTGSVGQISGTGSSGAISGTGGV